MLSYDNRPAPHHPLRVKHRHHVSAATLRHSRLDFGPAGSSRRCCCCCCSRRCFFVFGFYATAVLLLQNSLIVYHAGLSPRTMTTGLMTDAVEEATTKSTVPLRSVVASSPALSAAVTAARHDNRSRSMTEAQYYSRRAFKVNEYRHRAVLIPSGLCRPDTFMPILVHSGPTNVDHREAIRVTWGDAVRKGTWPNTAGQSATPLSRLVVVFVLGLHGDEAVNRAVREEHARHNDIIQGDFIDHYHNMTLKSLLDLKVVDERCPGVKYLLKSDDDMVINLPYLLDILTAKPLKRSFMGPYNPRSRVYREGVWKLTLEEFPFTAYPPYESGSAYVITGDLIHELFVTAEYVPHIFVDDVYVTGILGRILGVTHVRQRGFAYWGTKTPKACDIVRRRIVTGTKMHPQRLCALWNELQLNPKC